MHLCSFGVLCSNPFSSSVLRFFESVFKYVCECAPMTGARHENLLKDHITHNGICMIIALLGILIIHSARSASPPTSCWGVRVRLGTMSRGLCCGTLCLRRLYSPRRSLSWSCIKEREMPLPVSEVLWQDDSFCKVSMTTAQRTSGVVQQWYVWEGCSYWRAQDYTFRE